MQEAVKPTGEEYNEYIFVHVNDLLVLLHNPTSIMNTISDSYCLKNDSIQKPTTYLGAQIKDFCHPDDPSINIYGILVLINMSKMPLSTCISICTELGSDSQQK
jgi:hypothetical protein